VAGLLIALLLGFTVITWWVLESGGVAVAMTRKPDGEIRSTHVWFAETDEGLWLEAGTPDNGWYLDIQAQSAPQLTLRVGAEASRYRAELVLDGAAHAEMRELLRRKYGFRDRWVGMLVDTSASIAVRLTPIPAGEASADKASAP